MENRHFQYALFTFFWNVQKQKENQMRGICKAGSRSSCVPEEAWEFRLVCFGVYLKIHFFGFFLLKKSVSEGWFDLGNTSWLSSNLFLAQVAKFIHLSWHLWHGMSVNQTWVRLILWARLRNTCLVTNEYLCALACTVLITFLLNKHCLMLRKRVKLCGNCVNMWKLSLR